MMATPIGRNGALRRRGLRASRVPEEIKEGHRDAQGRNRVDRKTSERSDQGKGRTTVTKTPAAKDPTRNVWLQLGFPDAEEHFLKAEPVLRLDKAINSLGLTPTRCRAADWDHSARVVENPRRKIHRSFPRTADALSDRARLSYRDQNWGRAGKQGRGRHNQGCPTHGCVKRSRLLREGGWMRHPAALEEPPSGAPRPMKMGTIVSPRRYESVSGATPRFATASMLPQSFYDG